MTTSTKQRILVIDDDDQLGRLLSEYLQQHGLEVEHQLDARAGLAAFRQQGFDAVVMDVMMPHMDGMQACARLREFSSVPVIMLTALGEIVDRVKGLESGADDYLPKPFEPRELLARLQALMRRAGGGLAQTSNGDLRLDRRAGKAYRRLDGEDQDLDLTDMEFHLLATLIDSRPEPVTRDEIFKMMKGYERNLSDRSIDILVSRLRGKLDDKADTPRYIRTVRLIGYAFIG